MTDAARKEVWLALSDLFLDTDVSLHQTHIVRTLMSSPFDLQTLDRIFIEEVYPVCIGNLHDVAGEWAGFSEDALFAQMKEHHNRRAPFRKAKLRLRRRNARRMVPVWFDVRAALIEAGKT